MPTVNATPHYDRVSRGIKITQAALAPLIHRELGRVYGNRWYTEGVLLGVSDAQRNALPKAGITKEMANELDLAAQLNVITRRWGEAFGARLPQETRTYVNELLAVRNRWAHTPVKDWPEDDAWRALDTMTRLLEQVQPAAARETEALAKAVREQADQAPPAPAPAIQAPAAVTSPVPPAGAAQTAVELPLRPWREVIAPHDDVASGRYQQAEFAADLAQVLAGKAEPEYQDPAEFFARTYLTEGMRLLLIAALERLNGKGGEPVIQLKTAFGGGKTHTMLALFHLLRGRGKLDRLAGVRGVLDQAGVQTLPKAGVAVLVGTALDATAAHLDAGGNGIEVRTLWGEMAAQLGGKDGYALVGEADRRGVSPGGDTLVQLFDRFGPCVVLIDELVAYARNVYDVAGLPAGSFESILTFVQSLTEAARRSKRSMVVASIPESRMEVGGQAGQDTLARIEHTFGRVEAVWKPVGTLEGFEIVRRRLFKTVQDDAAKERACLAYSRLYAGDAADFPRQCREAGYLDRLRAAYPIHPEVFDRLYDDWASLERFQRTRGVLRLMAAAIHALWVRNDRGLLIQPGSLPLDVPRIRDELLRYLPEGWNTVIDRDVDGERSEPRRVDEGNQRLGALVAAERVARTVFLGSAPHVAQQRARGIEDARIRLGVAQPGESLAVFNDALGQLGDRLTYLYSGNKRYWYDTQPNLRRTAEERAQRLDAFEVAREIETRLRAGASADRRRGEGDTLGVHWCPDRSGADVPDEQTARLVVLAPEHPYGRGPTDPPAILAARHILEHRGNSPRQYRNMLVFLAPDAEALRGLDTDVRRFLAWQSIEQDADLLNLDTYRRSEAKEGKRRAEETLAVRLPETYSWLLVPGQEGTGPWEWEPSRLPAGEGSLVQRVTRKLAGSGHVVMQWSPAVLRMELDRRLWKDVPHLGIRKLWDYFCTYGYLPRLRDAGILLAAIAEGLRARDYFAYADSITPESRYTGLLFGQATLPSSLHLDDLSLLVKPDAAAAQEERDRLEQERRREAMERPGRPGSPPPGPGTLPPTPPAPPPAPVVKRIRRYHGTALLNPLRVSRDAGELADEIIQHLTSLPGATVRITLEIEAEAPDGLPDRTVQVLAENGKTLKLQSQGFEED